MKSLRQYLKASSKKKKKKDYTLTSGLYSGFFFFSFVLDSVFFYSLLMTGLRREHLNLISDVK